MDGISWKFAKVSSCRSSKNQHGLNPLLDNGYDVLVILELTCWVFYHYDYVFKGNNVSFVLFCDPFKKEIQDSDDEEGKAWKYAWAAPLFHFVPSSIPHLSAIRYLQSTYFWARTYLR